MSAPTQIGHYRVGRKIASGAFGAVYAGCDSRTGSTVAIKVTSEKKNAVHQLRFEYDLYAKMGGRIGPRVHGYYRCGGGKEAMVMELLGKSLDDMLCEAPGGRLRGSQVRTVAVCVLQSLQVLHGMGYVHKDLKPQNILWARSAASTRVFLIDYGISGPYLGAKRAHCAMEYGVSVKGTLRYMSTHTQLGVRPTRRDDLISLFYVLLQLCGVHLPWQSGHSEGVAAPRDEATAKQVRSALVLRYKMGCPLAELVESVSPKPLRRALTAMGHAVLSMRFDEEPPYEALIRLFDAV